MSMRPLKATTAATALVAGVAAVLIAACGSSGAGGVTVEGAGTAGYRVLAGEITSPVLQAEAAMSNGWPPVPSSAGRWWATGGSTATFPRTSKVEILAAGRPGVRFNLQWQETCGGYRTGKRGVSGGSGGQGDLTLRAPALVLVKLPAPDGPLSGCYLATTVSVHTRTWNEAKAIAPKLQIIHYEQSRQFWVIPSTNP
jgi:hypothetical protein